MRSRVVKSMGLVLVAVLVVWGCLRSDSDSDSARVRDLYGGPDAISTVEKATTVQVYRLPSPSLHAPLLADYKMAAGPFVVPASTATRLRQVLMNDSAYLWDVAKACGEPDYGIRFEFQHAGDSVDVLICFKCLMLGIYHNGKAVEFEDFDPIRVELTAIAKELFPDDSAIQSLR